MRRRSLLVGCGSALGGSVLAGGCLGRSGATREESMTVGVTTSVYDSGLVDELHGAFAADHAVDVRAFAAGTGEVLAAGRRGDVDALMAHAPSLEREFIEAGHGVDRRQFATSDFVVAGPPSDPAGIAECDTAVEAFRAIAAAGATFCSRGDTSGTHLAERDRWAAAGVEPSGEWYLETGQGMGATLIQADQQGAYLLTVRGNLLAMAADLSLHAYVEGPIGGGDPALENTYSAMAVNPERHAVAAEWARAYVEFLTGEDGQRRIEAFTVGGEQVFHPIEAAPSVDDGGESTGE
jgi:tungstate transport system substrate-binding protein